MLEQRQIISDRTITLDVHPLRRLGSRVSPARVLCVRRKFTLKTLHAATVDNPKEESECCFGDALTLFWGLAACIINGRGQRSAALDVTYAIKSHLPLCSRLLCCVN